MNYFLCISLLATSAFCTIHGMSKGPVDVSGDRITSNSRSKSCSDLSVKVVTPELCRGENTGQKIESPREDDTKAMLIEVAAQLESAQKNSQAQAQDFSPRRNSLTQSQNNSPRRLSLSKYVVSNDTRKRAGSMLKLERNPEQEIETVEGTAFKSDSFYPKDSMAEKILQMRNDVNKTGSIEKAS